MKRTEIIFLLVITIAFAGCATVDELKSTISTKVTSITSNVDPNLVAKVPEDKRGEFPKAENAVKLSEEKLKLAQMKTELAAKHKQYAGYEEDIVDSDLKDAILDYDIVKLKAIDAAGLGKKEDNIKTLTNLKLKKVDLQGDRIKADANMKATKRQIKELVEKIKDQEEKIKNLTAETSKPEEKATVPPEKEKKDTGKVAEKKPEDKAPAAPEAKTK